PQVLGGCHLEHPTRAMADEGFENIGRTRLATALFSYCSQAFASCFWSPSARAAMWALCKSGVRFRVIVHEDGTTERWPRLPAWEMPKRDLHERRPRAPEWDKAEIVGLSAAAKAA